MFYSLSLSFGIYMLEGGWGFYKILFDFYVRVMVCICMYIYEVKIKIFNIGDYNSIIYIFLKYKVYKC